MPPAAAAPYSESGRTAVLYNMVQVGYSWMNGFDWDRLGGGGIFLDERVSSDKPELVPIGSFDF